MATPTYDEIVTAYLDNADYEESASVSKCRSFITACRRLLLELPKQSSHTGASVSLNPELIADEMRRAQSWLASADTTANPNGGVRHISLSRFRT